jgi:hypothetical protein
MYATVVHAESVINCRRQSAGVPRRLYIHFGIAYQQRFSRLSAQFSQDSACA